MSLVLVLLMVFQDYVICLQVVLVGLDWNGVGCLVQVMQECWFKGCQVFLCGNGGSVGNVIYLVNDFLYGIVKCMGGGMWVLVLLVNVVVLICLVNDIGYDYIYFEQLVVQV